MKSLRVCFVLAGMLVLSASTLSAQASRVSCKDGSQPKVGHFSCWGHGGLVAAAAKTGAKAANDSAKKDKSAKKAKKATGKKAHSSLAKADKKAGKKAHAKRVSKNGKK